MKILAGALALALLALGITGWQLKGAWAEAATAAQVRDQALQAVEDQRKQADRVLGRLEALDKALAGLQADQRQNNATLQQALTGIDNITKTEGDNDASLNCLDLPAPAQLVDRVR